MTNAAVSDEVAAAPSLTAGHRYMPGLDVLRGLAIVLVLMEHGLTSQYIAFWKTGNPLLMGVYSVAWAGVSGVYLFFVLSGFLITGILLDSKHQPEYYKGFYIRRFLRIMPAYLALLIFLKSSGLIDWGYAGVCLLYVANMCSIFHVKPQFGPLWSLSVEEQFYLTWPLLVKRFSHRTLLWVSAGLIALVPLLRLGLEYGPKLISDWPHKTWGVADFFGAGSILAIGIRTPRLLRWFEKVAWPLLGAGVLLVLVAGYLPVARGGFAHNLQLAAWPEPYLVLWTAAVLIVFLYPQIAKVRVLGFLVFLADISYGLYLCHQLFLDWFYTHWIIPEGAPWPTFGWMTLRFVVSCAFSIAVAWISRRTFEAFFLKMKPKRKAAGAAAA